MKKIFNPIAIIISIFLLTTSCNSTKIVSKSNMATSSNSLVGIWHQQSSFGSTGNYRFMNADGTYYTLVFLRSDKPFVMQYGNYEVTSDNTYTETIKGHKKASLVGTKMKYRYTIWDKDVLLLKYYIPEIKQWRTESWKRITMESVQLPKGKILFFNGE